MGHAGPGACAVCKHGEACRQAGRVPIPQCAAHAPNFCPNGELVDATRQPLGHPRSTRREAAARFQKKLKIGLPHGNPASDRALLAERQETAITTPNSIQPATALKQGEQIETREECPHRPPTCCLRFMAGDTRQIGYHERRHAALRPRLRKARRCRTWPARSSRRPPRNPSDLARSTSSREAPSCANRCERSVRRSQAEICPAVLRQGRPALTTRSFSSALPTAEAHGGTSLIVVRPHTFSSSKQDLAAGLLDRIGQLLPEKLPAASRSTLAQRQIEHHIIQIAGRIAHSGTFFPLPTSES